MKRPNFATNWLFGARSSSEKKLLRQILLDTDSGFLKWAVKKIANWNQVSIPENVLHIHGTKDKILPFRKVKCDIIIQGGGHFMTLSHADEISAILKKHLE